MTIAVTGFKTSIVAAIKRRLPDENIVRITWDAEGLPLGIDKLELEPINIQNISRFVLAAGVLHGKSALDATEEQIHETFDVNVAWVIRLCETILRGNESARICVIGSESAYCGSYDPYYAASKAAMHSYVLTRKVDRQQQLCCVSPGLISDAGMTKRRHDFPRVLKLRASVTSERVAEEVIDLLHQDPPYYHGVLRLIR